MTTDEMLENLASMLGNIGSGLNSVILFELKIAQIKAERGKTLPWQLIVEGTTTTQIDVPRITVPEDMLRAVEYGAFGVEVNGVYTPLKKEYMDEQQEKYAGVGSGVPEKYALIGGQLYLFPPPNDAYTVRFNYYKKDTVLVAGGESNIWSTNYPDLLMGLAGVNLCAHQRTMDILPVFTAMIKAAYDELMVANTAWEIANMEMTRGE